MREFSQDESPDLLAEALEVGSLRPRAPLPQDVNTPDGRVLAQLGKLEIHRPARCVLSTVHLP